MITHSGRALVDPYQIFEKVGLCAGMRVADFGCGRTGHFVFPSSKIVGNTGIVYAIDLLAEVLSNVSSNVRSYGFDNVQTVWANVETYGKVPIPAGTIDVIFVNNVMFQIKNKTEALREAGRLLTVGGKLVIIDWKKKLATLGPAPEAIVKPDVLASMATQVGLELEQNFDVGEYHFCSIFKKKA